ncbi:MAG: alpha/beta fold hydrolase [Candidatus Hydrogenedentes bacterium]|nr:alpha/beta fold hydrolase [Candidatus Hydrogenedentota bacterium]
MSRVITGICIVACALVCFHVNSQESTRPELNGEVVTAKTPDGIEYGLWGTKVTYPAPTLFIFASDIKATLDNPYFRQCGDALAEQGYLCVSLDLPGHGTDQREGEPGSLGTWRTRSDNNEDFIAPVTMRVRAVLDHLIATGASDPARIAACGTSRGGFMALHVAAADPRIRATAAFAPVTNLMALREFSGAKNTEHVAALSLLANAEKFAGRAVWLIIGDRDERVSSDDAIAFARRVTAISLEKTNEADVTLVVLPEPKGHTTPKGAPELAAEWIEDKLK